jgi:methylase of polypeptide subunit release factors
MAPSEHALVELGHALQAAAYRFVTVTPETHARVLVAEERRAESLRDVFGWNLPFVPEILPQRILELAERAEIFAREERHLRARVRFSSIGDRLFAHSAFPTLESDAVFFGPDTYRFCAFVARSLGHVGTLVDVGAGSGAGGIVASSSAKRVILADVNHRACRFARVNAELAGVEAAVCTSDILAGVPGDIDAVIANPPYLRDARGRLYREGGGTFGEGLALRIVREALCRLRPGGLLVLYTGAPVVRGGDVFRDAAEALCREAGATLSYEELDPDVFGSELGKGPYVGVERIAAIGMVARLEGNACDVE